MAIKLRPYSETIKENMSKEDLIGWIGELEAEVREATDLAFLALEKAAQVCDEMDMYSYPVNKPFGHEYAEAIRALKSKP